MGQGPHLLHEPTACFLKVRNFLLSTAVTHYCPGPFFRLSTLFPPSRPSLSPLKEISIFQHFFANMHPSILAILSSTLAVLFGVTGAAPPHARSVRQHHAARTNPEDTSVAVNVTSRALEKRFDEARFTFYAVGLGACGKTNAPGDFVSSPCISSILLVVLPDPTQVVALNSAVCQTL